MYCILLELVQQNCNFTKIQKLFSVYITLCMGVLIPVSTIVIEDSAHIVVVRFKICTNMFIFVLSQKKHEDVSPLQRCDENSDLNRTFYEDKIW